MANGMAIFRNFLVQVEMDSDWFTIEKSRWPENTDPQSVDPPPKDPVHGLPYGPVHGPPQKNSQKRKQTEI